MILLCIHQLIYNYLHLLVFPEFLFHNFFSIQNNNCGFFVGFFYDYVVVFQYILKAFLSLNNRLSCELVLFFLYIIAPELFEEFI